MIKRKSFFSQNTQNKQHKNREKILNYFSTDFFTITNQLNNYYCNQNPVFISILSKFDEKEKHNNYYETAEIITANSMLSNLLHYWPTAQEF